MQNIKNLIKKAFGQPFWLNALCRINSEPKVIVLGFHDVREDHGLSSWLRMRKSVFAAMLETLGDHCRFIHPEDLFNRRALSRRRLNLLVTFDDGFANNRRVAMPLLQAFGVPALFFVSTDNLQRQSLFWFDRIVIPIQARHLQHLDLTPVGLGKYDFESCDDPSRRWDSIERLLADIKNLGNPCDFPVRRVLDYFEENFEADITEHKEDFRPMTGQEMKQLMADPLFCIGSHSHYHVILTRLNENELYTNLLRSKEILEQMANFPVVFFACPNGDTNAVVRKHMESTGYRFAYGTRAGRVNGDTDCYDIPRVLIGGYDGVHDIIGKLVRVLIKTSGG